MNRKLAEQLLADGHIGQKDFDAMFPSYDDVDEDVDKVLEQEPDMFLAKVIGDTADLAIAAKRRICRSKAAEARLLGVLANNQRDRAMAKQWFNIAYELRTMRS